MRAGDARGAVTPREGDAGETQEHGERGPVYEAANFPCFEPDENGDPCACCLHVTSLLRPLLGVDDFMPRMTWRKRAKRLVLALTPARKVVIK